VKIKSGLRRSSGPQSGEKKAQEHELLRFCRSGLGARSSDQDVFAAGAAGLTASVFTSGFGAGAVSVVPAGLAVDFVACLP
jgi:hypothetical protein